ncbi:MAG: hypothetical protein IPO27_12115 [Bacteroidetes bacterium]|nr:hypothetical protein [Bacteroidota bacterium]
MKQFVLYAGICLFLFASCKKKEEAVPLFEVTPTDFRVSAKAGDIISKGIKVTSEKAITRFIIKVQIQNDFQTIFLDSNNIGTKTLSYTFQYKVPETAVGKLIYLSFAAIDEDGTEGKDLKQIYVSDQSLTESQGHQFNSGFNINNNAFNLELLEPNSAVFTDSSSRDLQEYIPDSSIQSLTYKWFAPTYAKFVKSNNFNYAQATVSSVESQYLNSIQINVTDSIQIGDIYITRLNLAAIPKYVVIKITGITDQPGYINDSYIFNVKK